MLCFIVSPAAIAFIYRREIETGWEEEEEECGATRVKKNIKEEVGRGNNVIVELLPLRLPFWPNVCVGRRRNGVMSEECVHCLRFNPISKFRVIIRVNIVQ